jgi:hypothetical protein
MPLGTGGNRGIDLGVNSWTRQTIFLGNSNIIVAVIPYKKFDTAPINILI